MTGPVDNVVDIMGTTCGNVIDLLPRIGATMGATMGAYMGGGDPPSHTHTHTPPPQPPKYTSNPLDALLTGDVPEGLRVRLRLLSPRGWPLLMLAAVTIAETYNHRQGYAQLTARGLAARVGTDRRTARRLITDLLDAGLLARHYASTERIHRYTFPWETT